MDMIPAIATYLTILPRLGQFVNKNKHTYKYLCIYLLVDQVINLPIGETQQSTSHLLIGEGEHFDDPSNSEYSIIMGRQSRSLLSCWIKRGEASAQRTVQVPCSSQPKPRNSV